MSVFNGSGCVDSGQLLSHFLRIVDQHRQALGAEADGFTLEFQRQQGNLFFRSFAIQASVHWFSNPQS
jgi:hypothetical protein